MKITYTKLFWIYILASVFGVLSEAVYCLVQHGYWEIHVVSMIGPFCILYGIGAVVFYVCYAFTCNKHLVIQYFTYAFAGTIVELLAGLLLEFWLHMKAWDYSEQFLNIRGHVSFPMFLAWGIMGMAFSIILPYADKALGKLQGKFWKIATIIFSIIMALDLLLTAVSISRWSERHFKVPANNSFEEYLDEKYDNKFMKDRFCEWWFID